MLQSCRVALTRSSTRATVHRTLSTSSTDNVGDNLPLSGIRVLEMGQLIAGPFAGQLLGQFGAEVIKVEPPKTGDPLRVWRELDTDGTSPWFRSIGRNKKSVTIDLRQLEGRELVKKLAAKCDVVLENFKPGTLEKWSLGPSDLQKYNSSLIFTRVSGYGQTGPWAPRPGYASVCEAESGFRYINGFVDPETGGLAGPPVRPNISLGDSVAGLHAAFGTVLALLKRERHNAKGTEKEKGVTVDVSIVESMLNLMEGVIPEYDRKKKTRGPSGSSVTGIVPTNAYPCLPEPSSPSGSGSSSPTQLTPTFVVIGGNGDSIYKRLMHAIGRVDMTGHKYEQNIQRVARKKEIEDAICAWTTTRTVDQVIEHMTKTGVPVGRVATVKEIVENEQLEARGAIQDVWVPPTPSEDGRTETEGWKIKMPGTFPMLDGVDPRPKWAGPNLGQHTEEILKQYLGLADWEIKRLRKEGIIG
ncbi:L-carnitine dehydratase/bile acid-inducible protein F [Coprinopsis marcescibilis]|uniref:L-carnitine dehydratase/bile acid-inducible protein F n=1 Tax=Coprinopsis marcescibilis TaxID=230819 RepID=A0A5C3L184_COPMA|nr:L-carnitine dehydratase/bile acid-inducible protein F [Coprinopsis marcescibilis]